MIGGRIPQPSTLIGSTVVAPEVVDFITGIDRDPRWIAIIILTIAVPRMYEATVNAARDIVIAHISRVHDDRDTEPS